MTKHEKQVYDCFQEMASQTLEKEPGAKMYRFYRVEGKNEFVWMEKYEKSLHVSRQCTEFGMLDSKAEMHIQLMYSLNMFRPGRKSI